MGTKKTRRLFLLVAFALLHASHVFCAPVGNIGDPAIWEDGLFTDAGSFSIFISAEYDNQTNDFPSQQRRVRWDDPRTSLEEVRHYEQTRWSNSTMACAGARLGAVLSENWTVYAMTGVCDTELTFNYIDTTVNFSFKSYEKFESKGDLYYGVGTTVLLHKGTFRDDIPIAFGMDIKYRRFDFEDDNITSNGTFYKSTLDEIQFALMVSADAGLFHPYAGARISSITGTEQFINKKQESHYYPEGYINYKDDITWSKNLGFVAGISLHPLEKVSLNVESRFGDEEAWGFSATVKF